MWGWVGLGWVGLGWAGLGRAGLDGVKLGSVGWVWTTYDRSVREYMHGLDNRPQLGPNPSPGLLQLVDASPSPSAARVIGWRRVFGSFGCLGWIAV